MFRIVLKLLVVLLVLPSGMGLAQDGEELEPTFPDVRYVEDGDFKQKVDVYLPLDAPADDELLPTIFLLHGSGYTKWDMEPLAAYFVEEGYAAVAIEYRNPFPEQGQDVFCALAWGHSKAETYGFDPERFIVLGHSLGGFGAALLGVTDDPVEYLEDCEHSLPEENWLAGVILYAAGGLDQEVITDQIDGGEPPFLLIHGENDRLVSPEQSEMFAEALMAVDVDVTLVLLPEVGHFFTNPASEPGQMAIEAVQLFLDTLWENRVGDTDMDDNET